MGTDDHQQKIAITISAGTIVKTLFVIAVCFLFLNLIDIILIVLTAIVIASATEPAIRIFTRVKFPRVLATFIVYAGLLAVIGAVIYFIVPTFLDDLANFMSLLPTKITSLSLKSTSSISKDFSGWQNAVNTLARSSSISDVAQSLTAGFGTASQAVFSTLATVFGGLSSFLLIFILAFYFAVQEGSIEEFLQLISPLKKEAYIVGLWRRTQHKIGKWIQGQFILALIVGVLVYVGLSILRVQNHFFLAIVSTIFEIIPVFGPFIGSVPGVLVGFIQGGMGFGFVVAGMYLIIQQIESNVIYPLVVRKVLNIRPLVVIIALLVGVRLGGFLGIMLSVPIAAALTEYLQDVGKSRIEARAKLFPESENV
jgi:predicted PurR-regulated permease PerM